MKKISILIVFFIIAVSGYSQQGGINISDYQSDIEFLKDTLPKLHPNLYFHQSKEDFEKRLDAITDSKNLSNHNELEIIMQFREAIASLGDPHTNFGYYDKLAEEGYFPFEIFWFSDGIWVIGSDSVYSSAIGKKLVAINNIPIQEVIERISNVEPENAPYFRHKSMHLLLLMNGILKAYGINDGNTALFTFESINGVKKKVEVALSNGLYSFDNFTRLKSLPYSWQTLDVKPDDYLKIRYYEQDSILFVQYNVCWGREVEELYGDKETAKQLPSFNEFKEKIFKTLAEKPVKKMLFDMRFNSGGSSPQGTEMIKELSKIESINQKGKLFVAISQHSFSSAVINAMDFRLKTNAILIGQPAGGTPNHYGEVRALKLPKTGLEVYYSSKYFKYIDEDLDAVFPDVTIETNFSDIVNGCDPIYEYVKNY